MKGYKVFNPYWTCRGFQYEVGKTYKHEGALNICHSGFHFCRIAADCFNYYKFDSNNKVAEVEAIGLVESDGDKSVTDEIKVIRELSWAEVLELVNTGKGCTGMKNSGDWNSGNCNSGSRNSGSRNSGNCNSGDWNSGDWNSGNWNSGNCNSGNWNSGDWNSGNWNSGNCNSGNYNSGNCNSGDWNSGNCNSGWFNSITPHVTLFNQPSDISFDELLNIKGIKILNWNYENSWWIYSANMSEKEKDAHPEHETLGGYLKTVDYKTACAMMWERLSDEERQAVKDIPNFDPEVFKEITGIEV